MFGFFLFPFYILVPFFLVSVIFRAIRSFSSYRVEGGPSVKRLNTGIRRLKITSETSSETFEVYLYRLASKNKGLLTPAQIVVDSGLTMKEVETRLASMIDHVHIRMEVDDDGLITYEFPELKST